MDNLSRLMMRCCTVLFVMIFMGCSHSGGEEDTEPVVEEPIVAVVEEPSEPDPVSVKSFDEILIEDGFRFDMQRTVKIDISFSQMQGVTRISVYSETDPTTNTPINLLEKSEINNAMKYTSSMSVPSYIESMVVVIDGDSYAELDLPIDKTNHIYYLVE
ncbi:hypothetical protein [Shewanella violacea]|uniref:Lipoprotein n=1 Tax=Shewanella violacea (strain JCM 10179 / CIP 106290 / LMG 19151 / DSS12) TaxID=637905 RepID=D4ZBV3_SHEVD|nr:hypothetical protein [Shewanella violacea]BAJ03498.1 hypothetical protein SVI_3527 [Shewanella violacea DSS12]